MKSCKKCGGLEDVRLGLCEYCRPPVEHELQKKRAELTADIAAFERVKAVIRREHNSWTRTQDDLDWELTCEGGLREQLAALGADKTGEVKP